MMQSRMMMIAALTIMGALASAPSLAQTQDKAAAAAPKAEGNLAPSAAIPQANAIPQASARSSSTARAAEGETGSGTMPRTANEMK